MCVCVCVCYVGASLAACSSCSMLCAAPVRCRANRSQAFYCIFGTTWIPNELRLLVILRFTQRPPFLLPRLPSRRHSRGHLAASVRFPRTHQMAPYDRHPGSRRNLGALGDASAVAAAAACLRLRPHPRQTRRHNPFGVVLTSRLARDSRARRKGRSRQAAPRLPPRDAW